MDPVTHGLVGAVAASWTCSTEKIRAAMGAGALAAMAPDLDVLLNSSTDPLFQLEMHRQFSHSMFFAPLGAFIVACLLRPVIRRWLSVRELYLASLAGILTAGLLDACTSYGTQLLWPVSSARIAWNLTPVVEPLFSTALLILVLAVVLKRQRRFQALAAGLIALLLIHGAVQQNRAREAAQTLWQTRGHQPGKVVIKPTLGNQILWRVNYVVGDRLYADAVRTGVFSEPRVYPGEEAAIVLLDDFAALKGSRAYRDLERFSKLSDDYLIVHPSHPNVVGDGRYSMLPTSLTPLWGLEFDPEHPEAGPKFVHFRDSGVEVRSRFWSMLTGHTL